MKSAAAQGETYRGSERLNVNFALPSKITVINLLFQSSSFMHKENESSLLNYLVLVSFLAIIIF